MFNELVPPDHGYGRACPHAGPAANRLQAKPAGLLKPATGWQVADGQAIFNRKPLLTEGLERLSSPLQFH
jgi:hypothetical protein